jgi:hypothetical protein
VKYSEGLSGAAIQTAAYDMVREALGQAEDSSPSITIGAALRRLARIQWHNDYDRFESVKSEIVALREWAPDIYSIRSLSELFEISTRQVANALRGTSTDGGARTDSVDAGTTQ